jgi:hypothetical protein
MNSFVNLSGKSNKHLAVDEFNEWVVRAIKDVYNPAGTMQSTRFTCQVISPNVISLRELGRNVLRSSGAPTGGYRHSAVDDKRDVRAIVTQLLKDKVFRFTPGRCTTAGSTHKIKPSRDLYMAGFEAISRGAVLGKYIAKKLAQAGGGGDVDGILDGESDDESDEGENEECRNSSFTESDSSDDGSGSLLSDNPFASYQDRLEDEENDDLDDFSFF